MGQQQLLLVILVTIIVGIATVVAINTFGSAADQANIDAVNNDIATLASAAQGYFMRPTMLGGGGRSFAGLSFDGLAFPATFIDNGTPPTAVNENGRYELVNIEPGFFTINAFPSSSEGYIANEGGLSEGGQVRIAGVAPNNFELGVAGSVVGSN